MALELPASLRQSLATLEGDIPGVNWVEPEHLHLTLTYLGAANLDLDDLIGSLAALQSQSFEIKLSGLALYPAQGNPRALSATVLPTEALSALHSKTNRVVDQSGLTPPRKRYQPHVTLGRFSRGLIRSKSKQPMIDFLTRHALYRSDPVVVESFNLFSSTRTRHGQYYQSLAEFTLNHSENHD